MYHFRRHSFTSFIQKHKILYIFSRFSKVIKNSQGDQGDQGDEVVMEQNNLLDLFFI